jgi:hypothetical protein
MRAVSGQGCNKAGVPVRSDLPLHDMTGGNAWAADVILYQNANNTLRLGGGLTSIQIDALREGKSRALQQLALAASLSVSANVLRITNLTGHKLITGYPEGRRMWVNIKWYGAGNARLREDGAYGPVATTTPGAPATVNSLQNLSDPNTKVYEAHYGMTQEWALQLLSLGYPPNLPLSYDRASGAVNYTLGQLADQTSGTHHDTFHFVLNNTVTKDNRIPPYGFSAESARKRNTLPVPASQYVNTDGSYRYSDELALNPPAGAVYAEIKLLYQSTSWEYIQFLHLANTRSNAFLANEGVNLLNAWLNTGMAEPVVMATANWGTPPAPVCTTAGVPQALTATAGRRSVKLAWGASNPAPTGGYRIYYDQSGKLQFRASVGTATLAYTDNNLARGVKYTYVVRAWSDCNGNGVFDAGVDLESQASNSASATAQ